MNEMPDDLLFLLSLEHNDEAYNCLFNRYQNLMRQLAHKYCLDNVFMSYEELMCELYLMFYQAYCKYDHYKENTFFTYIYKALENKIRSKTKKYMIKNQFNEMVNSDFFETIVTVIEDYRFEPQTLILDNEKANYFEKIICDKCSDREKQVCFLIINGCSYEDIIKKLNLTRKQLYNDICRIRTKVKGIEGVLS